MSSFNWMKIAEKFELKFNHAFASYKNKAHFDNLSKEFEITAGSNTPWSKLLLLDAIIHIVSNESLASSPRRAFDQNRALCECVIDELRIIALEVHKISPKCISASSSDNTKSQVQQQRGSNLTFALSTPWDSLISLRESMLTGSPSETTNKFDNLVGLLTSHPALRQHQFDMSLIVQALVRKVIAWFKSGLVGSPNSPPTAIASVPLESIIDPLINSTVSFTARPHHTAKRKRDEAVTVKTEGIKIKSESPLNSTASTNAGRVSILKIKEKRAVVPRKTKLQIEKPSQPQSSDSSKMKINDSIVDCSTPLSIMQPSSCVDDEDEDEGDIGALFDTDDKTFFHDKTTTDNNSTTKKKKTTKSRLRSNSETVSSDDDAKRSDCSGTSTSGSGSGSGSDMSSLTDNSARRGDASTAEGSSTVKPQYHSADSNTNHNTTTPESSNHHDNNQKKVKTNGTYISTDPSTISYVLLDNVLCAVMPVVNDNNSTTAKHHHHHHSQSTQHNTTCTIKSECNLTDFSACVQIEEHNNQQNNQQQSSVQCSAADGSGSGGGGSSNQGETSQESGVSNDTINVY